MKFFLIVSIILSSLLLAADKKTDGDGKQKRVDKHIEKQMEREKKYAKEQTFYQSNNYNFKAAEVNQDLIDSVPEIMPLDDFDMDSVYD